MTHLNGWFKNSSLGDDWYDFAVDLVEKSNASSIQNQHHGGWNGFALLEILKVWYDSTVAADRSWQKIINALEELDKIDVIESIEKECKITKST